MYIMSKGKERNCRLCLKILDDDYNVIEEITKEIFDVLLLNVDLSVSEEPLVCKSCMKSVQEAFDFKSTCFAVNEQVVSLAIDRNSAELDIRDVYLIGNEHKNLAFNKDYNICRFCLLCLEKSNFHLSNDLREDVTDEMLLKCIPELDLNTIKEPVVCTVCIKSLESYYSFAMKCQNTEENILKYCKVQGAECMGQIRLSNVLNHLFKSNLKCNNAAALKEEDMFQNEEHTYSDINKVVLKLEEEEVIIKDENTYRDCKSEENRCDETKQKEIVKYDMLTDTDKDFSEKHMLIYKTKVTVYKCNLCSYKTKWKFTLKRHILKHKDSLDVVMYRCERCTFETKYKACLKAHMLTHKDNSEVTMYKCTLCSCKSKWKKYLKVHMLIHKDSSSVAMYRCEKCKFETKYKSYLKTHNLLIHKDNSEVSMYKCNLCSYESKWKKYLKGHMLTHKDSLGIAMYRCERCKFETKHKSYLKTHNMLIHKDNSEVSMYKCNLCSYESKWKGSLRSHMLIHKNSLDVVMYKCENCTFDTKRKSSLKNHMLIHTDNTKVIMYKCDLCAFETKWKAYLKKHMLIHKDNTEVIMYKCNLCNYETKWKESLRNHMVTHKVSSEIV